jgi:hypothetical protein
LRAQNKHFIGLSAAKSVDVMGESLIISHGVQMRFIAAAASP